MELELVPLILFGIAAGFSPGPNNIVTSYSAFNFGFVKTIPTMLGVISGWTLLSIFLVFGAGIIFKKYEELQIIIKILGSVYLIFLAYKISFSKLKKKEKELKPITFINTFFFQFINPKSIIAGLTAISLFIDTQNNYLQDSIIFVIVMFFLAVGSQATWCLMGTYLRKFATSEKFMSNFNYSMSFLLIVCVIMFYV
ncbi:LysE family translocator [Pelagibacteraceae bacterium]|nr:LysE family translocator [Pelagibacteraceae bacterium]